MSNTFLCDVQWFRSRKGRGVLAGSPLTFFKVSDAGARVLDALESQAPLPPQHTQLTDRLVLAGAIHPQSVHPCSRTELTVVIPALIRTEADQRQLEELVSLLHPIKTIVVDDASPIYFEIKKTLVLRQQINMGPAAARNLGLQAVETPYVAFVDTDVTTSSEQLLALGGYLTDERLLAIAPRIATSTSRNFLHEYESHHSPLDLGTQPAVVRPLSRVSYVPAATLVCHTEKLRSLEGFCADLRTGEDVDLVWRANEAGLGVRYVADIEVEHAPRPTVRALLQQRAMYGSSAAELDQRHPRHAVPLRTNVLIFLPVISLLFIFPSTSVLLTIPVFFYFSFVLRSMSLPLRTRTRVIWKSLTSTTQLTAAAIRRVWWPIFFLMSIVSARPMVAWAFCALVPVMHGLIVNKPSKPLRYFIVRILDDMSYGVGVWRGAIKKRSLRCLLPVFTLKRSSSR